MAVNRCICHTIPFTRALAVAREHRCTTVRELQRLLPIGTGCGLCLPYTQRAIETGETDLPVMGSDESNYWLARAGLDSTVGEDRP